MFNYQYFGSYSLPSFHTQNPFRKRVLFPSSDERGDLIFSYIGSSRSQTLFEKKHDLLFYREYIVERTHELSCLDSEGIHYCQNIISLYYILIWQHVSTQYGHLQVNNIKFIKNYFIGLKVTILDRNIFTDS